MKTLLIVYHTQTGNTEKLALAAEQGAKQVVEDESINCRVVCKRAFESGIHDLLNADGLLLATPENFGYMSGAVKDFLDRTFYPTEPFQLSLPYGLLISAGNDGSGAVREIDRIMLGYPMKKIMEPFVAQGELQAKHVESSKEIGAAMLTAISMGAF